MNPTTSAEDWQSVVPVFGIEKQSTLAIYLSIKWNSNFERPPSIWH